MGILGRVQDVIFDNRRKGNKIMTFVDGEKVRIIGHPRVTINKEVRNRLRLELIGREGTVTQGFIGIAPGCVKVSIDNYEYVVRDDEILPV